MFEQRQRTDAGRSIGTRRSRRVEISLPVVVHRRVEAGPLFSESTQTLVINAHGALMALVEKVALRQRLFLQNTVSGQQQECRVVYVKKALIGPTRVAVEFTRPTPNFWRIAFPPADWAAGTLT